MKEIVDAIGNDAVKDPMKVASGAARFPKRFYKTAEAVEADGCWELRLDNRPVRTPGRAVVGVPNETLAKAIAAEWDAQKERIDPTTMPLTRIVNSAIDGVANDMDAVRADIAAFAGSDLLCYRAEGPDALIERQRVMWDPVLDRFDSDLGAHFVLAEGVMPTAQPASAIFAIENTLEAETDPVRLAALHVTTTITGSALLALALARGWLSRDEAWSAAHVDEDWNRELWGTDEEAERRRSFQYEDMKAASLILTS